MISTLPKLWLRSVYDGRGDSLCTPMGAKSNESAEGMVAAQLHSSSSQQKVSYEHAIGRGSYTLGESID